EEIALARSRYVVEHGAWSRLFLTATPGIFRDGGGTPSPEVARGHARILGHIRDVFDEGARSGEIRSDLAPALLATLYEAALRAYRAERLHGGVSAVD